MVKIPDKYKNGLSKLKSEIMANSIYPPRVIEIDIEEKIDITGWELPERIDIGDWKHSQEE